MIIEINYHFRSNNQFAQRSFQLYLKNSNSTQRLVSTNQKQQSIPISESKSRNVSQSQQYQVMCM